MTKTSPRRPTALIADDEPLLRDELLHLLARAWPELEVVAQARNGREAVEMFEAQRPDICFLDVHMPGLSGVEAARQIGRRAHLVFVTAFDQYALKAFEQGVLDYLVKPVEPARLADTVARLKERLHAALPAEATEALLQQLAAHLQQRGAGGSTATATPLRWIRATVGQSLRLIAVDDIDFLRSDEKYTLIAWRGDGGKPSEALIRTPLKELLAQLDPGQFAQVHRSVVVNLRAISHVTRGENETADIHLKGRAEVLPVSRTFLHLFKQM
ncbi:LytTR family DNA-binding domain-containing protein [Ideonella sp.]|uniref:LytR/AlgR family response regulator transcription factor n=1 Tax=Ideonella sp. TaxID=1929293 RepID=UPI002B459608|nr:LytTR family DNA-binding domain-containing protein [Ideonella sp.]HJV69546.1 LytTR family DNA-binding domain-containing protein [Ideonella sp.]